MKVSIIVASNSEIISTNKNEVLNLICSQLYKNGLDVVSKNILRFDVNILVNTLKACKENSDCVLFLSDTDFEKSYVCKKIICEEFKTKLVNNDYAKKNMEEYAKAINVPLKREDYAFAQLPENSRCVRNQNGVFQGFLMEEGKKMLFFMPMNYKELYHMFFSSALPYMLQKKDEIKCVYVLKTFGIRYNEMISLLKDEIRNKFNVQIVCQEYLLDGEVLISVNSNSQRAKEIINSIYTKLSSYIYSDTDTSLPEMICDFLKMRNKTMVIAEDFTCGKLTNLILESSKKAKDVLYQSFIVTSKKAKCDLFNIDEKHFSITSDENEVAYEMALNILKNTNADITVATSGNIDSGHIVFALGTQEGIHVYSEDITGTNKQKILLGSKIVLLKLLKKLKKDSFNLSDVVV